MANYSNKKDIKKPSMSTMPFICSKYLPFNFPEIQKVMAGKLHFYDSELYYLICLVELQRT
ncbi:hypothetical protein FBU30_004639 [Linnemannia zychae]|nr:hypothetical protein FBU30_004639 [Linnemannia zychae]